MRFIQTWEIGDNKRAIATVGLISSDPPLVGLVLHDPDGQPAYCAKFNPQGFAALADALGKCARVVCKVALDGGAL